MASAVYHLFMKFSNNAHRMVHAAAASADARAMRARLDPPPPRFERPAGPAPDDARQPAVAAASAAAGGRWLRGGLRRHGRRRAAPGPVGGRPEQHGPGAAHRAERHCDP